LKAQLTAALRAAGYEVKDFGAHELVTEDDYPDFVVPLAKAVARARYPGLAICGSGVGLALRPTRCRRASGVDHGSFSAHQG